MNLKMVILVEWYRVEGNAQPLYQERWRDALGIVVVVVVTVALLDYSWE